MSPTPRHPYLDAVKNLLVEALGGRLAPEVEDYVDLFADTGVLDTPYGPAEERVHVVGRQNLAMFVEALRGYVELAEMRLQGCHLSEGGVAVLEYDGTVHQPHRNLTFDQSYIAVVRTQGGRITFFREYSDPSRAGLAETEQASRRAG